MTDLELRQLCLAAAAGTHSVIPDPSGVYAATILLREALTPDVVLALLDRLDALRPLIAAADALHVVAERGFGDVEADGHWWTDLANACQDYETVRDLTTPKETP